VNFTTRQDSPLRCAVRNPLAEPHVPDGRILSELSPAYFDSAGWINGGPGHVGRLGKWLNCV